MKSSQAEYSPLGKTSRYVNEYDPSLLFPIPRKTNRDNIGITSNLPFTGVDIWNAFEVSWLNSKGKPIIAIAVITIPCDSPNIIESKSLKLYLNSFNQTKFQTNDLVQETIRKDLSNGFAKEIDVHLITEEEFSAQKIGSFEGICLDDLDIEIEEYTINTSTLKTSSDQYTEETLYSHLLKSNCLVTGQPDWLSISIKYTGPKIDHEGLLRYIVSFRNCNEFTEQCIERVFTDILKFCAPDRLTVYGRSTRRGGIDINAFRSNFETHLPNNTRLARQ